MITYDTYSQKIFVEHTRRQANFRRSAKHVRFTYPLFLLSLTVTPVVIVVQAMRMAYAYDVGRVSDLMPRELFVEAMPIVVAATLALAAFALIVGAMWGAAKSRYYTFEAENLDLKTRQEYHLLCISKFLESVSQVPATPQPHVNAQAAQPAKETQQVKPTKKSGASSHQEDPLSQIVIHSESSDNDHEIRI